MTDQILFYVGADGSNVPVKAVNNGDGTYSLSLGTNSPLPADANLQVGGVDVSDTNLVPVKSTGESFTLLPSAARGATAVTNGTPVDISTRIAFAILLEFTAKADDVDDTCNVYIDMLIGATWVNAVHFAQVLGNAADASTEYALLVPSQQTITLNVSTNAGSGVVRPEVIGSQIRARWVIVDPAGADASFTFSVMVWAI
jgi:hypothetical protein